MANLKEVRIRISSVNSTQQITKAMKLVSATKLRKAQNAIIQMRPYSQKLTGMLSNLADSIDVESLQGYFQQREIKKVLLVVIASDRGLCGSFNANVLKLAGRLMKEKYAGKQITVLPVGKKSFEFFTRMNVELIPDFKDTFLALNSKSGFALGEYVLDQYKSGKVDKVEVVYNQFKNAATQILTNEAFLPIEKQPVAAEVSTKNDFLFEPDKEEILNKLIPHILKTQIYKALLDSLASEHGARMVAMDKATENAGDLLKGLKLEYNRARQAAITSEISEIVGGAAALSA